MGKVNNNRGDQEYLKTQKTTGSSITESLFSKTMFLLFIILGTVFVNFELFKDGAQINISDGALITIDSLITSSSVAFVNYSANSSGSSQRSRKLNWSNFNISSTSSLSLKILYSFLFPFTNNTAVLLSLSILFTIGIPFAGFNLLIFNIYIYTSVIVSGLILLGILFRFILFNSEPYFYSAAVFASKAEKSCSHKNDEKIKSFGRTFLNIIRGTKNTTLLNELAKRLNKYKESDELKILIDKFRTIIIESKILELDRVKVFYTFEYYSSGKQKIREIEDNFLSSLGISRSKYKLDNSEDLTFLIVKVSTKYLKNLKAKR